MEAALTTSTWTDQMARFIPLLILAIMLAGVLSPLVVPGEDEQVPPGQPLERELKFAPAK